MTPEEYVNSNESETVVERWLTVLPDGRVWCSYDSLEQAITDEPRDREAFLTMHAEFALNSIDTSKLSPPPLPAIEVVCIRTTTRYRTETVIAERHPMNVEAAQ